MKNLVASSLDDGDAVATATRQNLVSRTRHDLVQPLAAMKLLLARLGDDVSSEERQSLIDTFAAALEGIDASLDSVLKHLFFQHGVVQRTDAPIDLDSWLSSIAAPYKEKIEAAGVGFEFAADVGTVAVDENLLEIVVAAALDNAYQFTPSGQVKLSARRKGGDVLITVSDTGVGVRENTTYRLVKPFYTENADKARLSTRLGLGLTNATEAAALLDGQIELTPQIGGDGAVFTYVG